ncbi:MAG: hypothetical protein V4582_11415 [Pseudomonadota bacterium]
MNKSIKRPQRLALAELDVALQEALQRVAQAQVLSQDECNSVSGGIAVSAGRITEPVVGTDGAMILNLPTIGMMPPPPPLELY